MVGTQRERPLAGNGSRWPPGLPVPLTRFVGRERELAEVARLVAAKRLVTLTGAGGVGKTRLAIEAAALAAPGFGDGADFVDLSAVLDAGLLPGVLARGLGVEERAGRSLDERLVRVLRGQHRLLLVVDNCEHLRGPCAELVTVVLSQCPAEDRTGPFRGAVAAATALYNSDTSPGIARSGASSVAPARSGVMRSNRSNDRTPVAARVLSAANGARSAFSSG